MNGEGWEISLGLGFGDRLQLTFDSWGEEFRVGG